MARKQLFVDLDLNKNQLLKARYENSANAPAGPAEGQFYFNTTSKKFFGWNGTEWIDLSLVITGTTTARGEIANASTNPAFPANPQVGDTYFITSTAGTVGGLEVEIGDQLVNSLSGWFVIQRNLQAATQAVAGFVRLATQAEANAGSMSTVAISPATLAGFLSNLLYSRKFRIVVPALAANTPTQIVHGLSVLNPEDVSVSLYQGGAGIELDVRPTSTNALTIESNQALGNVTVVVQG